MKDTWILRGIMISEKELKLNYKKKLKRKDKMIYKYYIKENFDVLYYKKWSIKNRSYWKTQNKT